MSRFPFLFLLLSIPDFCLAAFCDSAVKIEAELELCDDNEKFAQAAERCKNDFLKAVEVEEPVLGNILQKNLTESANPSGQKSSGSASVGSYDSSVQKLDTLIARGLASRAEILDYLNRFQPPFRWKPELGAMPRRDDPELLKIYDQDFCFGEHRETILHMTQAFDKAIGDLQAARKKAIAFKSTSKKLVNSLSGEQSPTAAQTHGKAAVEIKGNKRNLSPSDITGTEEKKAKRD